MKAVICTKYGPPSVLQLEEIKKPIPKKDELLIKVKTSAVNSADIRVRGLAVEGFMKIIMRLVLGFNKPRKPILGVVFAGIVEEINNETSQFKIGDKVFGMTGMKFSSNAEYLTIKENAAILSMPDTATFEEAVALPFGGTTAIYFLEKAGIMEKKEIKVLIYGASGAVGTSAVQIAKIYNARVTAVCSKPNTSWIKELGADEIWAYDEKPIEEITSKFDIIFDCVGKMDKKIAKKLLSSSGKFVTVDSLDVAKESKTHLELLKKWFEHKKIKSIIDKIFPLEEIIQAHEYVDKGHKKGNVIITIEQ
ncbi:MAG: NAD(P)-dependent alcohol dehydrogenase [Limnohabitans sp.]|nr:NAD(P)-dependent alcohol dehydrogenase [Limnohabitans sp.]